MVVIHINQSEKDQFLYETTFGISVHELTERLVYMYKLKQHIERCADSVTKGCCCGGSSSSTGFSQQVVEMLQRTAGEARALVCAAQVAQKVCLTEEELEDSLEALRKAVSLSFPSEEAARKSPFGAVFDDPQTADTDEYVCTWIRKELDPNKKLSDYIGKNEKTKAIIRLINKTHPEASAAIAAATPATQQKPKTFMETDEKCEVVKSDVVGHDLQRQFLGFSDIGYK